MASATLRKKNRPKDPIKAYKQRLVAASSRVVDPYLSKVAKAIDQARRVHPRDGSEDEKRLAVAFRLFPRAIVRAASELRALLRRRPDRPGMLRLGREIGRLVDEEVGLARAESTAPPSACRKGCHFCCHLPVETTVPQVLVIADHLRRTLSPPEMGSLRKRMDEYVARVTHHPSGRGLALCPLNVDGACSVYEVRPTICRGYNSTDTAACEQSLANDMETPIPIDYAPIGAEVAVQAGYLISGLIQGQPYPSVPLVPALGTALDHPEKIHIEDYEDIALPVGASDLGGGGR